MSRSNFRNEKVNPKGEIYEWSKLDDCFICIWNIMMIKLLALDRITITVILKSHLRQWVASNAEKTLLLCVAMWVEDLYNLPRRWKCSRKFHAQESEDSFVQKHLPSAFPTVTFLRHPVGGYSTVDIPSVWISLSKLRVSGISNCY